MSVDPAARRSLSKRISSLLVMPPLEALRLTPVQRTSARRIGFSGPPGAGKSSLIAAWATRSLDRHRSVGVLAVDPSSPLSRGSLLGDRIRMDSVIGHADFFLRSVPSRSAHDGLCPNAASMLDAFEHAGFDDVVIETVGVGQAEYAVRQLVDIFVIVLSPQAGDIIQAMKAGILELADIVVVNKADLPEAARTAREIEDVVKRRAAGGRVPVVLVSTREGVGVNLLEEAIERRASGRMSSVGETARARQRYRIRRAVLSWVDEVLDALPEEQWDQPVEETLGVVRSRFERV